MTTSSRVRRAVYGQFEEGMIVDAITLYMEEG